VKINRINLPSWAREPQVRSEGIAADAMERLRAAREALLTAVHAEVSAYLTDPALMFDSADEFPSAQRLTGDYYIGDEHYRLDTETGRYQVAVMARCLAHPLPSQTAPDDYLGLEVWLESGPDCRTFSTFRNTDSSAI
jgi:hypothetical protein